MTNFFGDEVWPRKLTFQWHVPHLYVFIDEEWHGMVSPNGWQGDTMDIHFKLGEPFLNNLNLWYTMSFAEMKQIMDEYYKHTDDKRALDMVIHAITVRKNMTVDQAIAYIVEKKIPVINV